MSPEARSTGLQQIAADFARDGDLDKAKAALAALNLANPGQMLVIQGEQAVSQGRPRAEVEQIARLAQALGLGSRQMVSYLAGSDTATATQEPEPTAGAPAVVATAANTPVVAATQAVTATAQPAAPTAAPSTAIPTPSRPVASTGSAANLRSGPGTGYPLVGQMTAGQALDITARNAAGDWWQVAWQGGQAWVSGSVVTVAGPVQNVALAQNIPALPPTATPAPAQPTRTPAPAAAPTAAPKPGVAYTITGFRLRPVGQDAQKCGGGGDHNIWVYVQDAAGNRVDGVRVHELWTNTVYVTGSQGKGPGTALWDIYHGGGGQVELVDGAGNRISDVSRQMSDDWPDFDLMLAAGYCNCESLDATACQAALQNHTKLFASGHYVYEVTFTRTN